MSNINGPQYVRREEFLDPATPVVQDPTFVDEQRVVVDPAPVEPVAVVQQAPVAAVAPVAQVRAVAPVAASAVQSTYNRRYAPDAMIAAIVGLVLLIVGLLAIIRGGFDGSMEDPVVEVLGFTHTTTLGLIEIVLGVCLLISGVTSSRSGALFFGTVLGVGGFVGAVQTESFKDPLALESSLAWLMVIAAVVVVASALLLPRFATRSTSTTMEPMA